MNYTLQFLPEPADGESQPAKLLIYVFFVSVESDNFCLTIIKSSLHADLFLIRGISTAAAHKSRARRRVRFDLTCRHSRPAAAHYDRWGGRAVALS